MKSIVFTGGGTGGHVVGNLALIPYFINFFDKVYYIGSGGIEKNLIYNLNKQYTDNPIKFIEYSPVKLQRSLTPKNLLIPFKYHNSYNKIKKILSEIKPDIVFSKGGYVALPVVKAAQKLEIPTFTHESDLTLGLTNKLVYKKCVNLFCAFGDTASKYSNAVHVGNPIRQQIFKGDAKRVIANSNSNKPNLLIVGGSSGSKHINSFIFSNVRMFLNKYNIVHITGKGNIDKSIKHAGYTQLEYTHNIENYLNWADIVVSRAGSNIASELLVLQKLVLFIPLPKEASRGDQIENALLFEKQGVALQLQQHALTPESFLEKLYDLQKDKAKIIANINAHNYKDGTKQIVEIILNTARRKTNNV